MSSHPRLQDEFELPAAAISDRYAPNGTSTCSELHGDYRFPPSFELAGSPATEGAHYGSDCNPSPTSVVPRQISTSIGPSNPNQGIVMPGLVLPQAALKYIVAEVYAIP